LHKTNIHAEKGIQTSRSGDSRAVLLIGASLIAALIVLFLISTVFRPGTEGGSEEPMQAVPADSTAADSLTAAESEAFEDIPDLWLQARALSSGNAGWGPDVIAPFDTLWHIRSSAGREFFSSPAFVDGILYFGCNDGNLRAVDAEDGSVRWSYSTACGICGEPAVDSNTVYFGGQDGFVYALDRFSGSKIWSAGLGYHVFCNTAILSDTLIITGNSMGKVCALNAATGEPVWDDELGGIALGPVIVDSIAVFTSESGDVVAFDTSGNRLWSKDYSNQASPPSADETGVYAGFSNGFVRKFSTSDGDLIWETDIVSSSLRCVLARPVIVGESVLSGTNDGQLVSLSRSDGSVIWRQNFENWLQLPPAAGQDLLYVSCDDQRLHILELQTGEKLDSLEMDGYSGTAPLLLNGTVYFGNTSGDFTALRGTLPEEESADQAENATEPEITESGEEIPEEVVEEEIEVTPQDTLEDTPEDSTELLVEEVQGAGIDDIPDEIAPDEMIQALPADEETDAGNDPAPPEIE
jgi:eukaryotic-like serine/threonine-protein kinase